MVGNGLYRVEFKEGGKLITVGTYKTSEEAARAHDRYVHMRQTLSHVTTAVSLMSGECIQCCQRALRH